MSDEYKEEVKYAPDWPPKPKQSVDPSVHATLDVSLTMSLLKHNTSQKLKKHYKKFTTQRLQ